MAQPGRKREHATKAHKQEAYRRRQWVKQNELERLSSHVQSMSKAIEAARCRGDALALALPDVASDADKIKLIQALTEYFRDGVIVSESAIFMPQL